MKSPKARNTGCTKVVNVARKLQVGSTLPAGPGAACTACATICPARAMVNVAGKGSMTRQKNPGRATCGRDLYGSNVRSVSADVHGAQAHAAAGFDPALLQAAVEAGVDIEAADADADSGTPAKALAGTPVMAVVKAAGGSGRGSGNSERTSGDQTKSKLTKHFNSPVWREAVVVSLLLRRAESAVRSHAAGRIVFQECFVADRRYPASR